MEIFKLNENSSIDLKRLLDRLGYIALAQNSLGHRASKLDLFEKALLRFKKRNQEYFKFLNIRIENRRLCSNSVAGIIPLEFAIDVGEKANLMVEPMINWQTLSEFAAITKNRDWLNLNEDWSVSKVLDIELWYFSKPFLDEALFVLKRPAKGFKIDRRTETIPRGNTNWSNYCVQKYPYGYYEFENRISTSTFDVLPHSLIIWTVETIIKSIKNYQVVPDSIIIALNKIKTLLGDKILPVIPTHKIMSQLPFAGAWSGYKNLYNEIEHIAILAGVLTKDKFFGCAYSIKTERLFEEFIMYLCENYANDHGLKFFKDSDDSSRIGLIKVDNTNKFNMLSSLRPDIIMSSSELLIVIDSKYKRHYDLASYYPRKSSENIWEEEMRHDLHQIISYSIFSNKNKKLLLLTHPRLTKSSKYHIRRSSRNKNILIGYLPILFEESLTINGIQKEYFNNLDEIINMFNQ